MVKANANKDTGEYGPITFMFYYGDAPKFLKEMPGIEIINLEF